MTSAYRFPDGMFTYPLRAKKGSDGSACRCSANSVITYPLRTAKAAMISANGLQLRRHDHVPTESREGQRALAYRLQVRWDTITYSLRAEKGSDEVSVQVVAQTARSQTH